MAVLDNILGGGYFGLVKEGVLLQSVSVEQEDEKVSVAVKTLRGIESNFHLDKKERCNCFGRDACPPT